MSVDAWLKRNAVTGAWSQRQPLEPFPRFRHRPVAAGWEHMERIALHQLRRGIDVASHVRWFRAIDRGWSEPDGLVCMIAPARATHPEAERFLLSFVDKDDPETHAKQLQEHYPYELEVYQHWPGSRALCESLRAACAERELRGGWFRWDEAEIAELAVALDVVAQAWAHRRYWFGLDTP